MIQAAMIPTGGAGMSGLKVTGISLDQETKMISLTFTSQPGRSYSLFWTPNFEDRPDYVELNDSINANPNSDLTTYDFPVPKTGGWRFRGHSFLFNRIEWFCCRRLIVSPYCFNSIRSSMARRNY
ncbi:hypothetical protein N9057_06620, partial [Akkermansiaceae bacterium]|nr:hypothetical protein [Akkermansiaceae bacterium]